MRKSKIKIYLDYVPFLIPLILVCKLVWTESTTEYSFTWRNMIAVMAMPVNIYFFYRQHLFGVLCLGIKFFLGLFGVLSYTAGLKNTSVIFVLNNHSIEFWGQPIFLIWLLIHFIFSGRHYVGILTTNYWQELRTKFRQDDKQFAPLHCDDSSGIQEAE